VHESFTIARAEPAPNGGLWPCYFFKEGAAEVEEWVTAFCAEMAEQMASEEWPVGVGDPVAVIVADEDINGAGIEAPNYWEYYSTTSKSQSMDYTIDGVRTLQQWHSDIAKTKSGAPLVEADFTTSLGSYSPTDQDRRSYLALTMSTAYNYWRERSTWSHLRTLWPKTHLSQYILGSNYGVRLPSEPYGVPVGPGASMYHGVSTWKDRVAWDAYACLTNPAIPFKAGPDGGVIPVFHPSADVFKDGSIVSFDDQAPSQLVVESIGLSLGWLGSEFPVFLQFTTGNNNRGRIIRINEANFDQNTGTYTLTLDEDLWIAGPFDPIEDDQFVVFYPSGPGSQALRSQDPILWPLMETFCNRYGEPLSAEGFKATGMKWAAEQARAQTRALPEKPYTVYYGPGDYNGLNELVSFQSYYPRKSASPLICEDGWHDVVDWWLIGAQATSYGVNDFVWFTPVLNNDQATLDVIFGGIAGMTASYVDHLYLYHHVACIADWNGDGEVDEDDATLFGYQWMYGSNPETDLDNDGNLAMDNEDLAIFEAAYRAGSCGAIPEGPTNCDADWCHDGVVGVPDIFCFLSDWFAFVPAAREFGGTPGVPAIFAFLSVWFATGQGPCTP